MCVGACRPVCVVAECGDMALLLDASGDLFFAEIRQIQPLGATGEWQEGPPSIAANFLVPTPGLIDTREELGDFCLLYIDPIWQSEPARTGLALETNLQRATIMHNSVTGLNEFNGLVGGPVIDGENDSLRLERDGEVVTEVPAPGVPWDATSHFGVFMGMDTQYQVPVATSFDHIYSFASGTASNGAEVGLRCWYPRDSLIANGDHYEMKIVSDEVQAELVMEGVTLNQMTIGYGNFEMTDDAAEGHESMLMFNYKWQFAL